MNKLNQSTSSSRLPNMLTAFEILKHTTEFSVLYAGVEHLVTLRSNLSKFLPDYIVQHVEPGFIKNGILRLFTEHNAFAARLRQIKPRLLDTLQRNEWPVISINIYVRQKTITGQNRLKEARISDIGIYSLQELIYSIKPSPLKDALSRIISHHI